MSRTMRLAIFAAAAPGGPDIEQHDPAPELREASRLTMIVLEAHRGICFGPSCMMKFFGGSWANAIGAAATITAIT
jgi:GMP synthase-like glutamine amidotransferase